VNIALSQDFSSTPVEFRPANEIVFKITLPFIHLDISEYAPSTRGVYIDRATAFKFYNRNYPWTEPSLFMRVRWDSDLDASNGVTWSPWFEDNEEGHFYTVEKYYTAPGRYTITVEIEMYTSDGQQSYSRQKQYDIVVAPLPTTVYQDSHNNQLFYWSGNDGVLNRPAFLVEGFDPDNSNPPVINYQLGFNVIELARSQGYDVFIMEWADGGADLSINKDVFLGACQFIHRLLGSTEAAVQVVGISMAGPIARYGLAWAEDDSPGGPHPGQYMQHYINTFISFDGPQQGANLNTGLQNFIKTHGNSTQKVALQCVAAQQMLYSDVFDNTQSVHNDFYNNTLRALHNSDPLYGLTNGYPRRCKNLTISNGNLAADYPNFSTSTSLATIKEWANANIEGIVTVPVFDSSWEIHAEPRDLAPGSTFPHDLTGLNTVGLKNFYVHGYSRVFEAGGGLKFEVHFNPSYTPTESALDLDGYATSTDGSLTGGMSWFEDTLTQITFRRHDELTNESTNKVMQWLNDNRTYPYLGRPSNVSVALIQDKAVQLNFVDEAAFESGFLVERRIDGGNYSQVASIGANQTQYVDADPSLQLFKTYYYRIRSYAGSRFSPYSADVMIHIQPHLASDLPSALSTSSQRKLVQTTSTGSTDLYLAYESGGGSFLTHFNPAQWPTWDPEIAIGGIPSSTLTVTHPSLVVDPNGYYVDQYINVVYESLSQGSDTIVFAAVDINTKTTTPQRIMGTSSGNAKPVAALTGSQTGVSAILAGMWSSGNSMMLGLGSYDLNNPYCASCDWIARDMSTLETGATLTNPTNQSLLASIVSSPSGPVRVFDLAWEEPGPTGGIRFIEGIYATDLLPPDPSRLTWGTFYHVADNSSTVTYSSPSLARDGQGNIIIASVSVNTTDPANPQGQIVVHNGVPFSQVVAFPGPTGSADYPSSPSLSDYRNVAASPTNLTLVWSRAHRVYVSQYLNGNWQTPYPIAPDGQAVGIEYTLSGTDVNRSVVSVSSQGPPFAVSVQQIEAPVTQSISEPIGWNMVSVPVVSNDMAKGSIYPSGTGSAFGYQGSYIVQDPLISGAGYWLKFTQDQTVAYSGGRLTTLKTQLRSGWNLIGSISDPLAPTQVTTEPTGIINSNFFVYEGGTYRPLDRPLDAINPGQGYWVRTTQAGSLIFNAPPPEPPSTQPGGPPAGQASVMLPPTQISPANSATNQQLTLTLVWDADSEATQYRVQVSTQSDFSTLLVNAGILPTKSYQVGPLSASTTYYWRVNAANSEGTTAWSTTWSFTTAPPPSAPSLASPANGATGVALSPIVNWNASPNTTYYRLQVSTNSSFSTITFDDTVITTTSRQIPQLANSTTYYWRVNARNSAGSSPWSGVWSFTTALPPPAPVLASPANGATGQSLTPTVSWNSASGATSYGVDVSTSSVFSSLTASYSGLSGTSQQLNTLDPRTTYYWRADATNDIGPGLWSETWSFTTGDGPAPPPPTLSSPANGSTGQLLSLSVFWNSSPYATSYRVQVSTSSNFNSLVLDQAGATETSQYVSGLANGTVYYWRVNAHNTTGTSDWSAVWNFTTRTTLPPPCGSSPTSISSVDQLTISDAHGHRQKLFVENEDRPIMSRLGYIGDYMPPEPPAGAFSVRFQSDKFSERVSADRPMTPLPILVRDAAFPITLEWNFDPENAITYWLVSQGGGKKSQLGDTGTMMISDPGKGQGSGNNRVILFHVNPNRPCPGGKTVFSAQTQEAAPKPHEYALGANYPNPFNPMTEIHYDLPEDVHVLLRVYNVLGEEIATLIDEFEMAGYKMATFHPNDLPSGVYFYRLQAGKFTDVKKMILMR
jgi:lipase (class 2)